MTILEIENNLTHLISNLDKESFIFDLLLAYGSPKATIKRLQGSDYDKLATKGELTLRKKLFFKVSDSDSLQSDLDSLKTAKESSRDSLRFIIVTDFQTLLAYDTKTEDSLDIEISELANHYDFFLPLAGMEKATFQDENPADVKASLKMAKLYDELQKNNEFKTPEEIHSLNVFLTRLLCGFLNSDAIISDSANAIYIDDPWIFGVISSKMHMVWVRAVGGSLETRIRYSAALCYNTFPFPEISQEQKDEIRELGLRVSDAREWHSERTLAQLYDPDKMPDNLRQAHDNLDIAIENCYRSKPFESDEERLEHLFKLYEEMIRKDD